MKKYLIPLLILIIAIQGFFLWKKPKTITETTITVETVYVDVPKEIITYVPKEVIVEKPIYIPSDVDTTAILEKYYSKYVYIDTIKVLDYGNIVVQDTVTQNSIIHRSTTPNLSIPEKTITITNNIYPAPIFHYFVGVQAEPNSIGPKIYIQDKKGRLYGVGTDLINKNINVSASIRLR